MSWFEDQVKGLMDRGWSRKDAEKAIEETLEPMEIAPTWVKPFFRHFVYQGGLKGV